MEKKYVLAISFINYLDAKSGVAKVLMAHQQMYNVRGISYVDLFSVKKNICNDKIMLFCKFGLIIDGKYKGIYQMSQIISMLHEWQKERKQLLDIHLHHFLYTKISLIRDLLEACPNIPVKVYLHDYYNACTGYTLMKNDELYCGGRGYSHNLCFDCCYMKTNKIVQPIIQQIFKENLNRITFVSPSKATKDIFLNFHPEYGQQVIVIPHQKFLERYKKNLKSVTENEPIRVAFLGMPRVHKGWNAWKELVEFCSVDDYIFTVFNSTNDEYEGMRKVKIGFSQENLNAMTDALREYKVHVVLLWAIWPETYSYTCFEAFSANAFIITNKDSGNIADVVKANGNGLVLSNEDELKALFSNKNKLLRYINDFRNNTNGGPDDLYENDEIVNLSEQSKVKSVIVDSHKPINYLLLWVLNKIYPTGKDR